MAPAILSTRLDLSMVASLQYEIASKYCPQPFSSCLISLQLPLLCIWDLGRDENSLVLPWFLWFQTLYK